MGLSYQHEAPEDVSGIRDVNLAAFPTSCEADLVDTLRKRLDPWLSFVARDGDVVVGHVLFSPVTLEPEPARAVRIIALGPMAVHPDHQGRGIGSTLVDWSLSEVDTGEIAAVCVLGHPEWYPRFGFQPAAHYGIGVALDAPSNAFMLKPFVGGTMASLSGTRVKYHPLYRDM